MARTKQVWSVLRRARRIPRAQWVAHWRTRPVESDTVFYEATFGVGLVDSPYAIFRHLVGAPDFDHLHHVWVVADDERRRRVRKHLRALGLDERRVRLVGYRTPAYFRYLATAGYLVNNSTFPAEFGKRPGQVYVNTWHGTPLKAMGYDVPGGALGAANVIRNFLAADHLLSSGPYMTDTMYRQAYRLEGIAPGSVLEVGMPRTDVQVDATGERRREVREHLRTRGVTLDGRRVVLVAPTWRGEAFADPRLDTDAVDELVTELSRVLGDDWQVLVKAHPVVHAQAQDLPSLRGLLVPPDVPANEALAVTDHLVTDYSSILFDALADPRLPITFHVPDRAAYEHLRPLYLPAEELPGHLCTTPEETAADVAGGGGRADVRRAWAQRYAPFDDGEAAERVVDVVFRGAQPSVGRCTSLSERTHEGQRVPRVLIHGGSLQHNGVTSSLIALLGEIDLDGVDVSVAWGPARNADPGAFAEAVDSRVRLLPKVGGINGPKRVVWFRHLLERLGADHAAVPVSRLVRLLQDEWVRCFGSVEFDHVIDFGGYSPYWTLLMSRGVAPGDVRTHSIWLHNDLAAEVASSAEHGNARARHLEQVFSLYRRYDRLVSVSESLSRVNERSLAGYAGNASFRSARNVIDESRVRSLAQVPLEDLGLDERVVATLRDAGTTTFVTAGRLTHEKNQARLIRAAAATRAAGHDVTVVIMGSGPLEGELRALTVELGVERSVFLTGQVANPFPVVAAAGYFALTSEHEGLPMVILEALALKTPVLTTAFSSVEGVVPEGCGVVVPRDDDAVRHAMMELASARPAFTALDVDAYNASALDEFATAIGLEDDTRTPATPRPTGHT